VKLPGEKKKKKEHQKATSSSRGKRDKGTLGGEILLRGHKRNRGKKKR